MPAYGAQLEWLQANCGFAELNLTAEEYTYGGLPPEVPRGAGDRVTRQHR